MREAFRIGRLYSVAVLAGVLLSTGCAQAEPSSNPVPEREGLRAKGVTVEIPMSGSVVTARADSMRSDEGLDRIVLEGNVRVHGDSPEGVEIQADRLEIDRGAETGVFSGRVHAGFEGPDRESLADGGAR